MGHVHPIRSCADGIWSEEEEPGIWLQLMTQSPASPTQSSMQLSAPTCHSAAEQFSGDSAPDESDDAGSQVALLSDTACRSDDAHLRDNDSASSSDIAAAHAARHHPSAAAAGQRCGPGAAENLLQVHIVRPAALASALAALQQSSASIATSCSRRADSAAPSVGIATGLTELAASGRLLCSGAKPAVGCTAADVAASSAIWAAAAPGRAAALPAGLPAVGSATADADAMQLLAALNRVYCSMAASGHRHAVLTRCLFHGLFPGQ